MTARLHLADALQTYSQQELAFLKALANSLPKHVNLRAAHEGKSLVYLFEVQLSQRASFNEADAGAIQRAVLQARASLYQGALASVEALKPADPRVVQPGDVPSRLKCPKCGRQMLERPGKRRGEYVCVCESGQVDAITEQVIQDALRGRRRSPRYYR